MIWSKNKITLNDGEMAIISSPSLRESRLLESMMTMGVSEFPPLCSVAALVLARNWCERPQDFWKEYRELLACTNATEAHYRRIELQHGQKARVVFSPDQFLHFYQEWIHKKILALAKLPDCAVAYQKGKSTLDNAAPHLGKQTVVKLDIRHFFDSITEKHVYQAFAALTQYPKDVLMVLTKLCCLNGRLPQGACTSPTLSNLVMREFDLWALDYCAVHDLTYTRYSDDLTFSGDALDAAALISEVRRKLRSMGFALNEEKTHVLGAGACHEVTGLVCNETLAVPAAYRRKIRQEMHFLEKFGIEDHLRRLNDPRFLEKNGTVRSEHYLRNLLGRVRYVLFADQNSEEFLGYRCKLLQALYANACAKVFGT